MYGLEGQVVMVIPGQSACLACLYPEIPPNWRRRFPVIGAVAALAGNIGALEGIKWLTGLGTPVLGRMIRFRCGGDALPNDQAVEKSFVRRLWSDGLKR